MDSVGEKLDLTEVGTRYDHYMELKEVFMLGIEVINGMNPAFLSAADGVTKLKLGNAVEVIDKRIRYLADYDNKIHSVGREVKAAGIHREPKPIALLSEGVANDQVQHNEQPKDKHTSPDSKDKDDSAPLSI